MDARSTFRLISLGALLAATGGTGCGTLGGVQPNPSPPVQPTGASPAPSTTWSPAAGKPDPGSGTGSPAAAIPGGTVVATGGAAPAGSDGPPPPPGSGGALPQPRPVPPEGPPGYLPEPANPRAPVASANPHRRGTPTVTGGMLELAPWEVPTDRVIELGKQLELAHAQNHDLIARLKDLESLGLGREQALAEAMREVEASAAEAAKARAQVAGLQDKIRTLETDDIKLLRTVIEALNRLFPEVK